MVEIQTGDALRCDMCLEKRQVALLTDKGSEWTKYQICAPCTLQVVGKLIAGRRRAPSRARTKAELRVKAK